MVQYDVNRRMYNRCNVSRLFEIYVKAILVQDGLYEEGYTLGILRFELLDGYQS